MTVAIYHRRPVGWAALFAFCAALLIATVCYVTAVSPSSVAYVADAAAVDAVELTSEESTSIEAAGINWRAVGIGFACVAIVVGAVVFTGGAGIVAYVAVTSATSVSATTGAGLMLSGAGSMALGMEALDNLRR
jgi:hypothetical protein